MEYNLTTGKISKSLILFSLPMIFGNLIQQLYNIVDTLIVGRYIGPSALTAVGSSYSLMVLLTSIILGLTMGSSVVFSHFYGANKKDEMKTSIFNSFIFTISISIILNIIAFLLLDYFIIWLNIPNDAITMTKDYLKIILIGMIFVTIYNFIAAIFRSVGNTIMPLVFVAISMVLNIVLDIVFVVTLNYGVNGASLATVISQALSAILITIYFFTKGKDLCPNKKIMKLVIDNSSMTAIQQSIMNFGILMVQGLVNSFGNETSAAFTVVVKIDAFAYMPAQDFGNAFSTYVAQNYGAQNPDRIKEGNKSAFTISSIFCILSSLVVTLLAKPLMLIFVKSSETQIIEIGIKYLHIVGSTYIGIGILFLLYGFYRGLGKSFMSIILTIISLGTRVGLAYLLSSFETIGIVGIWWAIPIGWALADIFGIVYYFIHERKSIYKELKKSDLN